VPTVFVAVADPVGAGFVNSLARPGGNATGFVLYEFGIGAKWLALLKEITPRVTRAGVIRDASLSMGIGQFAAIQSVAPLLAVELTPINVKDATELERAVADFAHVPNGGLVVTGGPLQVTHRALIAALAARHKLPAVYFRRTMVTSGGLISYGPDLMELHEHIEDLALGIKHEAEAQSVREKTSRLRSLRLAKEAADLGPSVKKKPDHSA
jgi:putative tryptophan/tyrosine transport system substrate-binding protein